LLTLPAPAHPPDVSFPTRKTILCIDDQVDGLVVRKLFLEAFGVGVMVANSGRKGLEVLEHNSVDALLLDYRMPEMDGEAVAIQVRCRRPELPIVMLSGYVQEIPERVHSLVNAFVNKGSPPGELLQVLNDLLGEPTKKPVRRFDATLFQESQDQLGRSRAQVAKNQTWLQNRKPKK
jgi:CheY-like chemotaxis protein